MIYFCDFESDTYKTLDKVVRIKEEEYKVLKAFKHDLESGRTPDILHDLVWNEIFQRVESNLSPREYVEAAKENRIILVYV